jgi:hypothetical protein
MTTVDTIISALGGNQKVATMTHTDPKAISNWRSLGKFPAATYVALQTRLKQMGLSAPDKLWGMRGARHVKKRKARK